jgi:hypothetical protein
MKTLEDGGVEVTALHNHLIGESPRILYIHMGGHGDPVKMARTIKQAIYAFACSTGYKVIVRASRSMRTSRAPHAGCPRGKPARPRAPQIFGNLYEGFLVAS